MRKLFVLLAAVAFVFAFTAPAKADVAISGYIAFNTYMEDITNVAPTKDTSDLNWGYDNICSRLTFAFKDGPFGGLVEIRPNGAGWLRHFWGTWNFGAGTLGVGQFWTPDFNPIGTDKYNCGAMSGLGAGGSVRQPMIQLQFGNFKIAGATPATGVPTIVGYDDTETSIPKLMASYNLNVAMVGLKFYGGMNSVDARNSTTDATIGVDSYMFGVNATLGFGALTIAASVWTAENPTEYGTGGGPGEGYLAATATGTTLNDVGFVAYGLNLAWKLNDAWTVTGGYFTAESDRTDAGVETTDPTSQYHVNATWRVAKNMYISPEYIVFDRDEITVGNVSAEEATDTRIGIYWRIKF